MRRVVMYYIVGSRTIRNFRVVGSAHIILSVGSRFCIVPGSSRPVMDFSAADL